MSKAPAFYRLPHIDVPPLVVSIRAHDTVHGTRYTVDALDDKAVWVPLFRDPAGCAVRYCTYEFAMTAYRRWKRKADKLGVIVEFRE